MVEGVIIRTFIGIYHMMILYAYVCMHMHPLVSYIHIAHMKTRTETPYEI